MSFSPLVLLFTNRFFQAAACVSLVQRNNTFVHLPTGAGKTYVWLLAALALAEMGHNGVTIVVFPLVALLREQFDRLTQMQFGETAAVAIDEHTSSSARRSLYQRLHENDPTLRFLFFSPAMLVQNTHLFEALSSCSILLFVFDEYPTLVDWRGFYASMRQIPQFANILISVDRPPLAFLSATGTQAHVDELSSSFNISSSLTLTSPQVRPTIHHEVILQADTDPTSLAKALAKWIRQHRSNNTPVIFFTPFVKVWLACLILCLTSNLSQCKLLQYLTYYCLVTTQ